MDFINNRFGNVAVVWRDMTLVFGGSRYEGTNGRWTPYDPATIHCYKYGNWTTKVATGEIPILLGCPWPGYEAHVVGDQLYVLKSHVVYKLDLTTFVWSKIIPRGTGPLEYSSEAVLLPPKQQTLPCRLHCSVEGS